MSSESYTTKNVSSSDSSMALSPVANDILRLRYLRRDEHGAVCETPEEMFLRVAKNIASVNKKYGEPVKATSDTFFEKLCALDFVPASPILMNAGNTLQNLFSDQALDVPDSLEQIFEVLKFAATIQQHGGGLGFSFSSVRPRHDTVSGMKKVAFGPLSVMEIFDTSFSAILQGGRRHGANMAVLHVSHPDIFSFIDVKNDFSRLQNFNLSVALTDAFLEAVATDDMFPLINPRNGETVRLVKAKELFDALVLQAWKTGDPGIVFIDEMNKRYPFKKRRVLCTGSCGQYELESFEGVPYAHLNLANMVKENKQGNLSLDTENIKSTVHTLVHFLDNCIDAHRYINKHLKRKSLAVRKIGLGMMGFADLLFKLGISYGSEESLSLIDKIMTVVKKESRLASHHLALKRGSFPAIDESTWRKPMRHATITSIAPTGTTSLIAGVSPSIEPIYALSFTTRTSDNEEFTILNEAYRQAIEGLAIDRVKKIQLRFVDSVKDISWLDDDIKRVFKTAMDIPARDHLAVMARFQTYVDNSISKTINLPHDATLADVKEIFLKAKEWGCKGITIYRDGCRSDQTLNVAAQTRLSAFAEQHD